MGGGCVEVVGTFFELLEVRERPSSLSSSLSLTSVLSVYVKSVCA